MKVTEELFCCSAWAMNIAAEYTSYFVNLKAENLQDHGSPPNIGLNISWNLFSWLEIQTAYSYLTYHNWTNTVLIHFQLSICSFAFVGED